MKRNLSIALFALAVLFTACGAGAASAKLSATDETAALVSYRTELDYTEINQSKSVQLVRSMMELDYKTMTVADFNAAIEKLCEEAGTTVTQVYSDVYELFFIYDESGGAIGAVYNDTELEKFMTTLDHSSTELYSEHVDEAVTHLGSLQFISTPHIPALEMSIKKKSMSLIEWNQYFNENIHQMDVFPVVSYSIEESIADATAITVAERDERIDAVHKSIRGALFGVEYKNRVATFEDDVLDWFERISEAISDDNMTVKCVLQSIELDI